MRNKVSYIEREEQLLIHLEIEGDKLTELEISELKQCFGKYRTARGQILTIDYRFDILYNNVVRCFALLLKLMAKSQIVNVDIKVLNQQQCLIQELLFKLQQIEKHGTQ